jgi:hypothetical protein
VNFIKSLTRAMEVMMYNLVIRFGRRKITKTRSKAAGLVEKVEQMETTLQMYEEKHPGHKATA